MKTILWQGDFRNLNSFKLSNENLTHALEKAGIAVFRAPTDHGAKLNLPNRPDAYIFHNYPYNVLDAPGRVNLFFLQYEYLRFQKKDRFLVENLNCCFDALIVASEFTKRACLSSGVTIPVYVCELGFDPQRFNPDISPVPMDSHKSFKFINLGGAFERKGIDLLIQAYTEEFTAQEDVSLIIKAFSYQKHLDWVQGILDRFSQVNNAPEIIFSHEEVDEVGAYFAACDVGVFPYRGEGFGLTTLEALACGLQVIVTEGGSTDDFCNEGNSLKIRAKEKVSSDKHYLEPDLGHLRKLMRSSLNKKTVTSARTISSTVSGKTWDASARRLIEIIEETERYMKARSAGVRLFREHPKSIALITDERIPGSDNKLWSTLSAMLNGSQINVEHIPFGMPWSTSINSAAIVGRSGGAFEYFSELAEQGSKGPRKILLYDHYPEERSFLVDNTERNKVSVTPDIVPGYKPLEIWRKESELALADQIVVFDTMTQSYLQSNYQGKRIDKVSPPLAMGLNLTNDELQRPLRFLFWGTAPFQRGIHGLFEAWNSLKPEDAELICVMESLLFLTSPHLIKRLVQNPNITIHNQLEGEDLMPIVRSCDVQILPAIEDGYFRPVGVQLASGKPAIVSNRSGMQDFVKPELTGLVYNYNDPGELAKCIRYYIERKKGITEIKKTCHEHMQVYSYERFANELGSLLNFDHVQQ